MERKLREILQKIPETSADQDKANTIIKYDDAAKCLAKYVLWV